MLETIREKNKNIKIYSITDDQFQSYGRLLKVNANEVVDYLAKEEAQFSQLPKAQYLVDRDDLHQFSLFKNIQKEVFGELPIQIGVVQGRNQAATGTEFHQGSEVNIAVTDCLLVLGNRETLLTQGKIDISQMDIFYVPKGTTMEVYSTTLHYTPIEADEKGFSLVVVLIEGTNTDIKTEKGSMLTKKNKWYICHPSQKQKIEQGALPLFTGNLLKIEHE